MKESKLVRTAVRALTGLCLVVAASCGGGSSSAPAPQAAPNPSVVADFAAFDKNPNAATWIPVHADILTQQPSSYQSTVIRTLASGRVPADIVDDAVVDMGTIDWIGTMKWLRAINVGARSASNATLTRGTAKLTWMMFSLRSSWATDFVDLTRMDLRTATPYLASQVNLNNVDFAQAEIAGSKWVGVQLLNASFGDAVVDGPLTCTGCSFGNAVLAGTVTLQNAKWVQR